MRAVITGPTGAVGVSLINELAENDWQVIAVVRPNSKRISAIPVRRNVKVVLCSLENIRKLSLMLDGKYDVFFHLGWDGTYGEERLDMNKQFSNVKYTIDAVETANDMGCSVFVGAGSQSEFGHVEGVLRHNMVCNPDNGYGAAKLSACHVSRIMCARYNIRHEWCRIVSLYGPNDGEYTMVMSTIRALLKGESPKCTKGEQVWDYIYSKDAARAFRLVAENGQHGEIYCLGTGDVRKLKEYIISIRNLINPKIPIQFGAIPYYTDQVMHLEADITNLKEHTGFEPEYTFEQGILETIKWVKKSELKENI